jgi:DNA-binding MarR family transcriptional regulator
MIGAGDRNQGQRVIRRLVADGYLVRVDPPSDPSGTLKSISSSPINTKEVPYYYLITSLFYGVFIAGDETKKAVSVAIAQDNSRQSSAIPVVVSATGQVLLAYLRQHKQASINQLLEALGGSRNTLLRLTKRLAMLGLVEMAGNILKLGSNKLYGYLSAVHEVCRSRVNRMWDQIKTQKERWLCRSGGIKAVQN